MAHDVGQPCAIFVEQVLSEFLSCPCSPDQLPDFRGGVRIACLEGYFPAFPDCTAPTCFGFTDQPTAPGEDSSCCKWRDSAASEWVPAGETRPCSYEMGEEPGLRIGLAPTLWGWPAWG